MNNPPAEISHRRRRCILVAGNKSHALISLTLLLRRFAYNVVVANTATQAFDRISAVRPDLVITDLVLHGMSGIGLLQELKQDIRTVSTPVVFMVHPGDAAAERRCLDTGAAGCIAKPVQPEELYRTVQEVIEPKPRSNIRIGARLPVSINNVALNGPHGECEVDLSEHGMYVPMNKPCPTNRRIIVKINIKDRTISAEGAVMYNNFAGATEPGPRREPGIGLKFVNIAPWDREFIRMFIHDELTHDISAGPAQGSSDPWN